MEYQEEEIAQVLGFSYLCEEAQSCREVRAATLCEEQEALGHREEGIKFPISPRGGPTFLPCFHGLGAG